MRTILSVFLLAALAATAACSGASSDPKPQGEVQCGPPNGTDAAGKPVCEKGCYWAGKECKPDRGIIVLQ